MKDRWWMERNKVMENIFMTKVFFMMANGKIIK